jgi:hypothetical protein
MSPRRSRKGEAAATGNEQRANPQSFEKASRTGATSLENRFA